MKKLSASLIKQQWGQNLSLMNGMALIGGATVNGDAIYQAATAELEAIKAEMIDTYSLPGGITIG